MAAAGVELAQPMDAIPDREFGEVEAGSDLLVGPAFEEQLQSSQLKAKMWRADSAAARGHADGGDDGFGGAGVLQ